MLKRWEIFRKGEHIATMTAQEIRQALRDGEVDPFDVASIEGSSIERQVLEIEEIFDLGYDDKEESIQEATRIGSGWRQDPALRRPNQGAPKSKAVDKKKLALAASKVFLLHDRHNRTLGPLSAREVLGLYSRGVLSKRVMVEKRGYPAKVPIQQFIAAYGSGKSRRRKRPHPAPSFQSHAMSLTKVDALKSSAVSSGGRSSTPWELILTGIIGVLLGLAAFKYVAPRFLGSPAKLKEVAGEGRQSTLPKPKKSVRKKPPLPPKPKQKKSSPWLPVNGGQRESNGTSPAGVPPPYRIYRPAERKWTPKTRRQPAVATPVTEPVKVYPKAGTQPVVRPPMQIKASQHLQKGKPRGTSSTGAGDPYHQVGQVVTSRPSSFNRTEFSDCGIKCTLRFREPGGKSFTGVFFKSAYESVLQQKSSVVVTGTVKKQGGQFIILVRDIN